VSLYKKLNQDFSGDVNWLRKELVKKILDEGIMVESYELFSQFIHSASRLSVLDEEFVETIYRIKSVLPTSKTSEISGDIVEEIVKRESSWADGWQKWHEYKKSSEIATEAKERFDNYQKQYGQYTDC
jgi:hypothetical protein